MSRATALRARRHRCPYCRSEALRRSLMRGIIERWVLRMIGIRAFRCEDCDQRHYGFRPEEAQPEKKGSTA